jgi:hypothetical protein
MSAESAESIKRAILLEQGISEIPPDSATRPQGQIQAEIDSVTRRLQEAHEEMASHAVKPVSGCIKCSKTLWAWAAPAAEGGYHCMACCAPGFRGEPMPSSAAPDIDFLRQPSADAYEQVRAVEPCPHCRPIADQLAFDQDRANRLSDECGRLATENRELLAENATLRRKLERAERKRGAQ